MVFKLLAFVHDVCVLIGVCAFFLLSTPADHDDVMYVCNGVVPHTNHSPPPAGASTTWFHLYRCVLAAAAPAAAPAAADVPTASTIATLLEQYMQTSTLGQYSARLRLLQGVQGQLMTMSTPSAPTLAAVVYHVGRYYGQFQKAVNDALEADLKLLRQHLKVWFVCVAQTKPVLVLGVWFVCLAIE